MDRKSLLLLTKGIVDVLSLGGVPVTVILQGQENGCITHVDEQTTYLLALRHWIDLALKTSLKWSAEPVHRCWALTWRLPVLCCRLSAAVEALHVSLAWDQLEATAIYCHPAANAPPELDPLRCMFHYLWKNAHAERKFIYNNKGAVFTNHIQESTNQDILDCSNGLPNLICSKHAGCSFKKMYDPTGSVSREKTKSNSYIYNDSTGSGVHSSAANRTKPCCRGISRLHAVPPPPQQVTPADIDKQLERWREEQWRSRSLKRHQRWWRCRHGSGGYVSSVEAAMARRRATRMLPLSLEKSW